MFGKRKPRSALTPSQVERLNDLASNVATPTVTAALTAEPPKIVSLTFSYDRLGALKLEQSHYQESARNMYQEIRTREEAYQTFRRVIRHWKPESSDSQSEQHLVRELFRSWPELTASYNKARADGWDGRLCGYDERDRKFCSDMSAILGKIIWSLELTKGSIVIEVTPEMAEVLYHPWGIPSAGYRIAQEEVKPV